MQEKCVMKKLYEWNKVYIYILSQNFQKNYPRDTHYKKGVMPCECRKSVSCPLSDDEQKNIQPKREREME